MVVGPPKGAVGSHFQTASAAVVKSHGGERRGIWLQSLLDAGFRNLTLSFKPFNGK